MAEHTPGFWEFDTKYEDYWVTYAAPPNDLGFIAHIEGTTEEDKANAHLIAAAPELLEALEYVVLLIKNGHPLTDTGPFEAAIAKAKGEL